MKQGITYLPDEHHDAVAELARVNHWSFSRALAVIVERYLQGEAGR